jgi:hypothetical protein
MTHLISEHAGILYPSDLQELGELITSKWRAGDLPPLKPLRGLPAAIIVPHASYTHCLPQLRQAFSSTFEVQPELIAVLAPLHRPCLREDADKGRSIFCPESSLWETPGGKIELALSSMDALAEALATDFDRNDCYFQEEYAIELLLPFCLRRFPSVPLLPILADLNGEAGWLAASKVLKHVSAAHPKTLIIISSNPDSSCGNGWIHALDQISNSLEWIPGGQSPPITATKEWI